MPHEILQSNFANSFRELRRFGEAKSLSRKKIPVARRVLGESHELTLRMKLLYAKALYEDTSATLDDLRKAANTLEETARIARRVFSGSHPRTVRTEASLRDARAMLRARETPSPRT